MRATTGSMQKERPPANKNFSDMYLSKIRKSVDGANTHRLNYVFNDLRRSTKTTEGL